MHSVTHRNEILLLPSICVSSSMVLTKGGKFTIPRAELLGALLMAEQSRVIYEALKSVYNINEIHYWVDSAMFTHGF